MLEAIELACSRNDKILFSGVNFRLAAGEALRIHGKNGSGKTTLLKTIAGILPLAIGKLASPTSTLYLGHKHNIHPALSPLQNLRFLAALSHSKSTNNQPELLASLDFAGLNLQHLTPCSDLSAGQVQRINLARLYLTAAKLWLLDEPFINLDSASKLQLETLCAQHVTAGGMLLIATHNDLTMPNYVTQTIQLDQYA